MSDLMHSKKWKTFMQYVNSLGAAVVLLGALFKLQHWPGGAVMLTIGMSTEVLIFLLGIFEHSPDMPDWKKVYPQLRGPEDEGYDDIEAPAVGGGAATTTVAQNANISANVSIPGISDISPEIMEKVEKSLKELGNCAQNFADLSSATMATDVYVRNLNSASESMNAFAAINNKASETIDSSLNQIVDSYDATAKALSTTGKDISEKITTQTSRYGEELEKVNTSLSSLSDNYNTQLSSNKENFEKTMKLYQELGEMNGILLTSIEEAKRYKDEAAKLNENITALNSVYGSMLGAMNSKVVK